MESRCRSRGIRNIDRFGGSCILPCIGRHRQVTSQAVIQRTDSKGTADRGATVDVIVNEGLGRGFGPPQRMIRRAVNQL